MDKYGNRIIAVDFDKTLSMANWPEVGEPYEKLFKMLIEEKKGGTKIVLFTCRTGEALRKAVTFCNEQGLYFDAINDNVPTIIESYGDNPRKISADLYIDDKAVNPGEYVKKLEHIDKINRLSEQIKAILDLLQMTEDLVDIRSIKTASDMCLNMHEELMQEVEGLENIR